MAGEIGEYEGARQIGTLLAKWPEKDSNIPDLLWQFKSAASRIEDFRFVEEEDRSDRSRHIEKDVKRILSLARQFVQE